MIKSKVVKNILVNSFWVLCAFCGSGTLSAQIINSRQGIDTLTVIDRLSLHSNAIDWLLLTPNLNIEYDVRNTNWSRWSAVVGVRGNWQTSHTYVPDAVYNLFEFRGEFRNYWRTKEILNESDKHKNLLDKLFSCRRTSKYYKHPATAYYRGLYVTYGNYSIKLGKTGKQGKALGLGFTYGCVHPLYIYPGGSSIDLDFGVSVGMLYTTYDKYVCSRESNCYPIVGNSGWHLVKHPVVSQVKIGLIYRMGKYPSTGEKTTKYRWRYEVDKDYAAIIDSISTLKDTKQREKIDKQKQDSIRRVVVADSLRADRMMKLRTDSINKSLKKQQKLEEKELRRLRKDSVKLRKRNEEDSLKLDDSLKAEPIKQDVSWTDVINTYDGVLAIEKNIRKECAFRYNMEGNAFRKRNNEYDVCLNDERRRVYGYEM